MLLPVSLFSVSGGRVSIFLTSCVNNFSGWWGRVGWVKFNVGRQFPASFQKHFETNQISSVALVYCEEMSAIISLGVKKR